MMKSETFSMVDPPPSSPTAELNGADNYRSYYTTIALPAPNPQEILL